MREGLNVYACHAWKHKGQSPSTHNPWVVGSSPTRPTSPTTGRRWLHVLGARDFGLSTPRPSGSCSPSA